MCPYCLKFQIASLMMIVLLLLSSLITLLLVVVVAVIDQHLMYQSGFVLSTHQPLGGDDGCPRAPTGLTVGFHNFNLRIFKLRVSNPNEFIVDVFLDTMSDFNVPGSRPYRS